MKWREHKRLAIQMAEAFGLDREAVIEGSVEPDKKRTVVHTWPKARRSARAALYRARRASIQNNLKKCSRWIGICSHYIEDGMIHGTMDSYSYGDDHSTLEGQIGQRVNIETLNRIDNQAEGLVDGEFVFREIDALVSEGLDHERLGQALSLLGSAVLDHAEPPQELIENRARFLKRIRGKDIRILAASAGGLAAGGGLLFGDPLWLLLLPFAALYLGQAGIFRALRSYGWLLPAVAFLGFLAPPRDPVRIIITVLSTASLFYLQSIPDLTRLSEKWFRMPPPEKK